MSVRSMSKAMLVSLMLTAGSSGAYAAIIDFEDVAAGTFATTTNFATGGSFQVDVDAGNAIVDQGTGAFAAACGGDRCSDNGTQALYVFDSGKVTLTAPGFLMNVTSFDAAIAQVNDLLAVLTGDPSFDLTSNTSIRVTGAINANFGGGFTTPTDFDLSPPGNESFVNQLLVGFANLDSISFEYFGASTVCNAGCSTNFAIDNIALTTFVCDPLTPGTPCSNPNPPPPPPPPGQVPEPSTLALVGTSFSVLLWRRRREKRRSL